MNGVLEKEKKEVEKITFPNTELKFKFDIGIIELLGSQLYTKLPSIIVEFISNAYDADATEVEVIINENDLGPDKVTDIIIKDNGIGISDERTDQIEQINNKFLKIGRRRRKDEQSDISKIYHRKLQGKKGIGKLAGFGITDKMEITTTSHGITNSFMLDLNEMKAVVGEEYLPRHIIKNERLKNTDGTIIKLIAIKRTSSVNIEELAESIVKRIQIFDLKFKLNLTYIINNMEANKIELTNEIYLDYIKSKNNLQFTWKIPECLVELDLETKIIDFFKIHGINGEIFTTETPLKKDDQGIILYANGKLCQENYSFNERANDNFYSYLMGTLNIDYIDSDISIDNISTARDSLVWENEIAQDLKNNIDQVIKKIQTIWRQKRKNGKEEKVNKNLDININDWIDGLAAHERDSAKKLVDIIISDENISTEKTTEFISYIQDMYSFSTFKEFASRLIKEPISNLDEVLDFIKEWEFIEAKELAKISEGRIKTINNFETMILEDKSETKFIQPFLESFPWILDPRIISFEREVTYRRYLKENFDDSDLDEPNRRIDFLTYVANGQLFIMELKRPNLKIKTDYIIQVHDYKTFIQSKNPNINVKTYLITNNCETDRTVESLIEAAKKDDVFEVKTYTEMISEARQYHKDIIAKFEELSKNKEESV